MQTKSAPEDLQNYLTDASNMAGGYAEKLFLPENADEIAEILRDANAQKISVTISGARTGTVGGAVPFGGFVISLERMNKIRSIRREKMTAVVEPGVILGDFQKAVEAEGMLYPPDPTEWSCQIGGTVATNASGARSFKYGATRGFVQSLEIVLASGDRLSISRGEAVSTDGQPITLTTESGTTISFAVPTYERPDVRKNVSGFYNSRPLDAIDLFIGSEGTLGVITEIELSLVRKPEGFFSGIVFFERESDLLAFVDEVKADGGSDLAIHANPQSAIRNPRSGGPVATAPGSDPVDATLLEYFDDRR